MGDGRTVADGQTAVVDQATGDGRTALNDETSRDDGTTADDQTIADDFGHRRTVAPSQPP